MQLNPFPHRHLLIGLKKKPFEKIVGKGFSAFPTMFSTVSKTEMIISITFNLSPANAFNLVQFKILSCGNRLKCRLQFVSI